MSDLLHISAFCGYTDPREAFKEAESFLDNAVRAVLYGYHFGSSSLKYDNCRKTVLPILSQVEERRDRKRTPSLRVIEDVPSLIADATLWKQIAPSCGRADVTNQAWNLFHFCAGEVSHNRELVTFGNDGAVVMVAESPIISHIRKCGQPLPANDFQLAFIPVQEGEPTRILSESLRCFVAPVPAND